MCSLCGQHVCVYEENGQGGPQGSGPQMSKPVFTNQEVIDQIDSGTSWTSGGSVASTITYGITTNRNWFPASYGEYAGWSALNTKQAAAANLAIELWDDVIASDIVAAANPNSADIRFSNSSTGVNYAHAYYPGETGADSFSYQKAQGSIWLNPAYDSLNDPDVGEYGFMAIVHEIGHALGLDHPGTYNGGSPTYANDALYEQDTHMYTVMSYFDAQNTGADWYAGNGWWYYAQTPMLHDVLVAQSIYGADMSTRSTDTVYGFNSTADRSVFDFTQNSSPVLTIWDGGGNDTLDLSGWNTDSQISLVEGSFSHTNSMTHNISIAFGAEIENAVGGGGHDQITGNSLANTLRGLGGNDTIDGAAGNDWIDGGVGVDTLFGGAGDDTIVFDASDNLAALSGGSGSDTLVVNGGSVPVFDLAAHGFEFADHVQVDAGGAAWAEKTDHYDASWIRSSQDGTYDAGGWWRTEWDVSSSFVWSQRTFEYDDLSRLTSKSEDLDDGTVSQTTWDVDDVEVWARQSYLQDVGDINAWSEMTTRYDDLNRYYEQTGTYDDGRTWHTQWDVDDTEIWWWQDSRQDAADLHTWDSRLSYFDDQQRKYDETITYDDGLVLNTQWDVEGTDAWWRQSNLQDAADTRGWSQITTLFDDLNRYYDQTGTYDDGRTWHTQWDVDDTELWWWQDSRQDTLDIYTWDSRVTYFDDLQRKYDETISYDDGLVLNTLWDVDDVETWWRQATLQDAADTRGWSEMTTSFDHLNRYYEQTGAYDDGRTWQTQIDVDDTESWHTQTRVYDTANNHSWSEQISEYDEFGTLTSYVVIDDPIV